MKHAGAIVVVALFSVAFRLAAFDTNQIQRVTGLQGKWNAEERVFKIAAPRTDVKVAVDKWPMPPFMGLTSWAAFKPGVKEQVMVMGDLVLFQDEVNPVMSALFENGLDVTALHNHFFYDEPKAYFMHIGGEGVGESLAKGVRAAFDAVKQIRAKDPQPVNSFGGDLRSPTSVSADALHNFFGTKGEVKDGMVKFVFGRAAKMPCGCEVGREMGLNTWAAFAGADDNAVVDGDFACREEELQPVLRSLRKSRINIVAIHHHMTEEQPRYVFLHYWGRGKAIELANAVRLARGEQSKAGAVTARAAGGFEEIDPAHFNKHREDGAVVLDVRSPDEFAKGHIPGAINVDINAPGFDEKVGRFDKSKPILVNCHAGSRGAIASAELARLGFKTVCNLEGGMSAWEKAGNKAKE